MQQDSMVVPTAAMLPPRDYYSMTQLRAFFSKGGCNFVYYLRYILGYKARYSSAAWLGGTIVHRLVQQAYHGIPLKEAHRRVWQNACDPVFAELQAWYTLDQARQASGRPNTRARERWTLEHPAYAELAASIEAYRDEFLTEDYTWAKDASLAAYYRWCCELVELPREQLLLPHAVLVEGQTLYDADGALIERFADEGDTTERYTMLFGTVGDVRVGGVPDVIAIDPQGTVRIADVKVMSHPMSPEDIAEDGQLNLYLELCRQAGIVAPGQQVYLGHLYCTERHGVKPVWSPPSPDALARLAWQFAHMDRRIKAADFLPVQGIATGAMNPCLTCEVAAACRTERRTAHLLVRRRE
jgi:hypothetical protein